MPQAQTVHAINIRNWEETGVRVRIDQYQFDLEVIYDDADGNLQTYNGTHVYPNDLSDMPLNVRKRYADEQVIAKVRVALGIDTWDDYV